MPDRPLRSVLLFSVLAAACVVGYVFLSSLLRGLSWWTGQIVPLLFLATTTLGLNAVFLRNERRSLADLGFDKPRLRARQFGLAFGAGCALTLVWAGLFSLLTKAGWQPSGEFSAVAAMSATLAYLMNNIAEELVYRGYGFLRVSESYGRMVAVVGTSAVFALLHIQSGVPWDSAVTVVFTSGVLYAVLFDRWRSVPFVLGFHVANNVMQDALGLKGGSITLVQPIYSAKLTTTQHVGLLLSIAAVNVIVALVVGLGSREAKGKLSTPTPV